MLFTVGHSNHSLKFFLALLQRQAISVVVDVRSAPYSRYVTHFNKGEIEQTLRAAGLHYIYMGDVIGGKPKDKSFYNTRGQIQYDALARTGKFQRGLDRLATGLNRGWRIVLMCAEEDPSKCHRHQLIARALEEGRQVPVWHVRADGALIRAGEMLVPPQQLQLF